MITLIGKLKSENRIEIEIKRGHETHLKRKFIGRDFVITRCLTVDPLETTDLKVRD